MIKSLKLKLYKVYYRIRYVLRIGSILEVDDFNKKIYLTSGSVVFRFDETLQWGYYYNLVLRSPYIKNHYNSKLYFNHQHPIDELPWWLHIMNPSLDYSNVSPLSCILDIINQSPKMLRDELPDWFTEAIVIEELKS